jgi:NhaP-type Na+/H+ or K+/H+ antiporter
VRSVVDFYRARPLVGVLVFCIGLAIAVATVSLQKGDGVILPIAFTALMGIVVGSVVGLVSRNRRRREAEESFDFDDADLEPEP